MTSFSNPVAIAAAFAQAAGPLGSLPYWLQLGTSLAILVIALALLVVAVAMVPIALAARKLLRRRAEFMERAQQSVDPLLRSAFTVADNLTYVSTAIRENVEQVSETLALSQRRLNHAAGLAEQRLEEFSALLEVVQEEAEDLFIGTASTLRGVREGATRLREMADEAEWEEEPEEEPLSERLRRR